MPKYILKRVLQSVLILFLVGLIIYGLLRCLPTSYIENMARQLSTPPGSKSFDEWMQQLEASYGLDKGIVAGYFGWLKMPSPSTSATAGCGPCPCWRSSKRPWASPS